MPTISDNPFIGLDAAFLAEALTTYKACFLAIGAAGQSYTINSRTFTKANLDEVKRTLAQINQAIRQANGTALTYVQATV